MAKIDDLIRQAQETLNKAKDEDKATAQAALDALKAAKASGVEMDNDEVNGLVARKQSAVEDEWKNVVGMSREEAKRLFEELEDDEVRKLLLGGSPGGEGDGEGDDDKPVAERIQEALKSRDSRIESLSNTLTDVNKRYSSDKVEVAIERAFREEGLRDDFLDPAKRLAAYGDLVEKVANGQTISNEEIAEKVNSVKTLSGVWFKAEGESEEENGNGDGLVVAGHKLKEEAVRPAIPATPAGDESAEITEEDRAARATSVY